VKQTNILARASKLTKAGGRLIYSTCSLLSDENEQIAENFLVAHPDFKLLNAAEILKQQQINLDTGDYLKLLPHLHNTDGFFAAVFEKTDDSTKSEKAVDTAVAEAETVEESVTTEPKAKKAAAKSKVTKPKAVKEAAVEETLDEKTAVKIKAAKPKIDKEKVVKDKVVKEKVVKPKAVKTKAVKE
jgi:16S rRNA (cytosine967-C5)-methyltransferase